MSVEADVLLASSSVSFPCKDSASRFVSPCSSEYDIIGFILEPSPIVWFCPYGFVIPSAICAAVAVY